MKYKLTFWQRIELIPLWIMWIFADRKIRAKWDDLKSGMEKHEHKFTILNKDRSTDDIRFYGCEHRGCNLHDVKIKYKTRFYE